MKNKTRFFSTFVIATCLVYTLGIRAQIPQLWDMTFRGGSYNDGVVFKINGNGTGYDTVFCFNGFNGGNGNGPVGNLIIANDGKLYGMTSTGGINNCGVIFVLNFILNPPANNGVLPFQQALSL